MLVRRRADVGPRGHASMIRHRVLLAVAWLVMAGFTMSAFAGFHLPNLLPFQDPCGIFRTLSLRPIELSNAATLMDVVNFYDQRFNMLLTDDEKADLVAFMSTL